MKPVEVANDAYFAATTDRNGQYAFSNVPPGRYKLFAWEDVPAGAYQYPDFIRRYEDRGQTITVPTPTEQSLRWTAHSRELAIMSAQLTNSL
jgi:hypothetical protein